MRLRFQCFRGPEATPVLDDLAHLRIRVFQDWPYLYDGDLDYERAYLQAYTQPGAIIVGAYDGDQMVGAATGMPLSQHGDEFGAALSALKIDPGLIFYCAESVLLPDYRGQGAGHVFFDEREAEARRQGFNHTGFCGVQRPADHPARPETYRALDGFWRKRGYAPVEGAIAHFSWKDIGAEEADDKPLQFWMREL